MGHSSGKLIVCSLFVLLIQPLFALDIDERSEIEALVIDTQLAGKGGGAALSPFAQFVDNPAFGMFEKRFILASTYLFLESFSNIVYDNKTTKFGGGIMYERHRSLNTMKTNTCFPLYSNVLFLGVNFKFLNGDFFPLGRSLNAWTFDAGLAVNIADFIFIGASITDFVPMGENLPMRISGAFEIDVYKRMLLFNIGGTYHLDHHEETNPVFSAPDNRRRSFLAYTDLSVGAEFRYKYFSTGIGFASSSFSRDFTFTDLLKTVQIGIHKPYDPEDTKTKSESGELIGSRKEQEKKIKDGGGFYAGFYFSRDMYVFSLTLVWEPM